MKIIVSCCLNIFPTNLLVEVKVKVKYYTVNNVHGCVTALT